MNKALKENGDQIIKELRKIPIRQRCGLQLLLTQRQDSVSSKANPSFGKGYKSALYDFNSMIAESANQDILEEI